MNIHKRISPGTLIRNEKLQKIAIGLLTFLILFFICSKSIIPQKYELNEGDIAPADIKAPRDFVDKGLTEARRQEAIKNVPKQYTRDYTVQRRAVDKIRAYFNQAVELKNSNLDQNAKIEKLKGEMNLADEDYITTLKLSVEEIQHIANFLINEVSKTLSEDIKDNEDLKAAQERLDNVIRQELTSKAMRDLASDISYNLIKINSLYDEEKTNEEKDKAIKAVSDVIIKKGQIIISKGEPVTSRHISLMRDAGILEQDHLGDIKIYSGIAVLVLIVLSIIVWYIYKFKRNVFEENSKLLIISIVLCINSLFIAGINVISPYLIPAAFTAILMALIFDPLLSFVITLPIAVIVACITNFNYEFILLYIISSIAGILFTNRAQQRNNVLLSGFSIGVLNGIVIISIGIINNINITQNLINGSKGIAGGILSGVLAIGILPIFEGLFDIITPIKLLELSNPNQPLLKKMLFEAPGTYHHSILVGNLSEAAADEIGANSLLARVGSYYHDIGKMKRPYFFKENQITNDNPHDKITPKLSTLIITSHVKDGIEMAKKHRLPSAIIDIIAQHHGTTLVRYFYVMAIKDGKEVVEEASFRYEGPKPESKESAIVMLADSVEAAVRSLTSPTIQDIEKMVDKIVNEKVEDGQLDNADLALKDIGKIKKAFIKVLIGIFHNRIEYPEIEKETKDKEEN
ncbi:HD family phosphohydrolase [Fonticella tunisiensis]|nr:HDIG domain-containing metalloprotein [Fonticella tunisiensis]